MVRSIIIPFLTLLFLASCAQVGTISGGSVDEKAPVIKSMNPENQSTNVAAQEITLVFEDFIKLNNPTQTIQVIPPDFKVNASNKGKTVILNWVEPMQANTTYSIFLNKTIQDITESNDSIMQLVFSTGDFIDSLTYSCFVIDAILQTPAKKVIVGLFSDEDTLKPTYFSETNEFGEAKFNYLKEGDYFVRAYIDLDNNLKISKNEPIGFKDEPLILEQSIVDSIPISLFPAQEKAKITTFLFQGPGTFIVGANRSIHDATFSLNNEPVPEKNIRRFAIDSLLICFDRGESKMVELVTQSAHFKDTNKLRISGAKAKSFQIKPPKGNKINYIDAFDFTCTDQIIKVDTSKIRIINQTDSTRIVNYIFATEGNLASFTFDKSLFATAVFQLEFDNGALIGATGAASQKASFPITVIKEKELGSIILDLSEFSIPLILDVKRDGTKVRSLKITNTSPVILNDLEIGEYTFKIIDDKNKNGLWDTGDFQNKTQAETIHYFNEATKVRANWEINVQLAPNN